jgi:hypothetical protein
MGIFAIASDGQRIGIGGWEQQFCGEWRLVYICTESEEKERASGKGSRILQLHQLRWRNRVHQNRKKSLHLRRIIGIIN